MGVSIHYNGRFNKNVTLSDLIDSFSIAIKTIPIKQEESFEDYFEQIQRKTYKRCNK